MTKLPIKNYDQIALKHCVSCSALLFYIDHDIIYYCVDDESQDFHDTRRMQLWKYNMKNKKSSILTEDISSRVAPVLNSDEITYLNFSTNTIQTYSLKDKSITDVDLSINGFYIGISKSMIYYYDEDTNSLAGFDRKAKESTVYSINSDCFRISNDKLYYSVKENDSYSIYEISAGKDELPKKINGIQIVQDDMGIFNVISDDIYYVHDNTVYAYDMKNSNERVIATLEKGELGVSYCMKAKDGILFFASNSDLSNNLCLWYVDDKTNKELMLQTYQE